MAKAQTHVRVCHCGNVCCFCPVCGIRSFAGGVGPDGREVVAINVRCLEGVDPAWLRIRQFDGRSL